jgi:hypothetical protein
MSYGGNPASSTKDLVRFLIGDTESSAEFLSDAEINAVVALQPNPVWAAAACADAVAAKVSRKVDKSIGKTSVRLSQQVDAFRKLADRLRKGGAGSLPGGDGSGNPAGGVFIGGVSIAEGESIRQDTDINQNSFSVGQDDMPGTGNNTQNRNDEWKW